MLDQDQRKALAVCLVLVLLGFFAEQVLFLDPKYDEYCYKNEEATKAGCSTQKAISAVLIKSSIVFHKFSEDIIALFTIVLSVSTIGLWAVTYRLAKSTKVAAEHIPIVEKAYVYPRVVDNNVHSTIGEILKGHRKEPFHQTIDFRVKNYGKTPAFLKSIVGVLSFYSDQPRVRIGDESHVSGEVALEAGSETEKVPVILDPPLSRIEIQKLITGEGTLVFSGWITFEDIWGEAQPSVRFSWVWNHTKGVFIPHIEPHKK